MTTKLEHSINPLSRAPHNFAFNRLIINHPRNREPEGGGLLRAKSPSMDRIVELQKVESMRKMMLMQEQLFKQQVQELHRIYNLQKKLMQEAGNGLRRRKEIAEETTNSEYGIRHQTATESKQSSKALNDQKKEASGSNSAENSRIPIKFDLEMPAETESISTPSSSIHPFEDQIGLKKMDEEADVEVELTLSIGHCTRKRKPKSYLHNCSTELTHLQDSDQSKEVQQLASSSTEKDTEEAAYDQISLTTSNAYQQNTLPRWLLQDLSLNRT